MVWGEDELEEGVGGDDAVLVKGKIAFETHWEIVCDWPGDCPSDYGRVIYYDSKKIENPKYSNVYSPFEYLGKLSYIADIEGSEKSIIVSGNNEITPLYDEINEVKVINSKLAYSASDNKKYFIIYDGKKIGSDYGYVWSLTPIGNRIAFATREFPESPSAVLKFYAIIYNGQEIGKEYISVGDIIERDDKLAFIAEKENNKKVVVVEK